MSKWKKIWWWTELLLDIWICSVIVWFGVTTVMDFIGTGYVIITMGQFIALCLAALYLFVVHQIWPKADDVRTRPRQK